MPAGPSRAGRQRACATRLASCCPISMPPIGVIGVWWAVVLIAKPHMSLLPSPLRRRKLSCSWSRAVNWNGRGL